MIAVIFVMNRTVRSKFWKSAKHGCCWKKQKKNSEMAHYFDIDSDDGGHGTGGRNSSMRDSSVRDLGAKTSMKKYLTNDLL